ncbi:hypothetical protein J4221_02800 [Candidatus Pacearchaeota archaeon]|nr:hypothetical protein [Candidatus Pacearchaeota archaeon]
MNKKIEKEIKEEVDKEIEKRVGKEVERRSHEKLYYGTIESTRKFREEFKNQAVIGITAAFAFLIALSWRTPIEGLVNKLIERLSLTGQEVYIQFLSAIIITILAVIVLIYISKWKSDYQ